MTAKRVKQYIENTDWSGETAHIAMTTDLGACSEMNEAFVFKSLDETEVGKSLSLEDLTEDQIYILREIGELPESLDEAVDKQVSDNDDTSVTKTQEPLEDNMSEQNTQIAALQKQVAVMTIEKALNGYGFSAEVETGLAEALCELEDISAVTKAMDELVARVDEAVDKAKESLTADKEEMTKALRAQLEDEHPLAKQLDIESGHAEVDTPVAKSLVERAAALSIPQEAK